MTENTDTEEILLPFLTPAAVMEDVEPQGLPDVAQVTYNRYVWCLYRKLSVLQKVLESDRGEGTPRPRVDVQSLNTRGYLDHTVVPILLDAMAAVAKER